MNSRGHDAANLIVQIGATMDEVTPERKEELRLAIRKIMRGLFPLIDEVRKGVACDPSQSQCPQ